MCNAGQDATVAPRYQSVFAGASVRSACAFLDFPVAPAVVGLPADPSAVTAIVLDDTGNTATLSPVKDAVGQYHADYAAAMAGEYRIVWTGTGAVAAVDVGLLTVNAPAGTVEL